MHQFRQGKRAAIKSAVIEYRAFADALLHTGAGGPPVFTARVAPRVSTSCHSDSILVSWAKRRKASYIPPKSLNNDPLDQQILACAQSMAAMVANNAFVDDANCRESQN